MIFDLKHQVRTPSFLSGGLLVSNKGFSSCLISLKEVIPILERNIWELVHCLLSIVLSIQKNQKSRPWLHYGKFIKFVLWFISMLLQHGMLLFISKLLFHVLLQLPKSQVISQKPRRNTLEASSKPSQCTLTRKFLQVTKTFWYEECWLIDGFLGKLLNTIWESVNGLFKWNLILKTSNINHPSLQR